MLALAGRPLQGESTRRCALRKRARQLLRMFVTDTDDAMAAQATTSERSHADVDTIMSTESEDETLWKSLITEMGEGFDHIANAPVDPSMN